jgi:hypothetical protein
MLSQQLEVERLARILAGKSGREDLVECYAEKQCGAPVTGTVACTKCGTAIPFQAQCTNSIEFDEHDADACLAPELDDLLHELELALVALDLAGARSPQPSRASSASRAASP